MYPIFDNKLLLVCIVPDMHKQNFKGKRLWVEFRDLNMVPMQMPFGITTVSV